LIFFDFFFSLKKSINILFLCKNISMKILLLPIYNIDFGIFINLDKWVSSSHFHQPVNIYGVECLVKKKHQRAKQLQFQEESCAYIWYWFRLWDFYLDVTDRAALNCFSKNFNSS
jgi:hypothetical protein